MIIGCEVQMINKVSLFSTFLLIARKMFSVILAFIIVVSLLLRTVKKPKNFPPGPPCVPFLGSGPFLKMDNFHFTMDELSKKYGPVIGVKFGLKDAVLVSGKKEVEEVLRREEFQGRPQLSISGKGVMFSDGEFWMHQRRFTLRHLRDFGFGKNTIEDIILAEIDDFFENFMKKDGVIQISGIFNTSAVNVLWAMMGGQRYSHDDPEFQLLLDCLQRRFRSGTAAGSFKNRFPIIAKLMPFLEVVKEENETEKLLNNFFEKAFKEHRQTLEGEPRDFIDVYLSELDSNKNLHSSFTELTLMNVCKEFFSAGAESVGNSLGFDLLYCVLYPEWQEKLYEEITSVIGKEAKPSLHNKKSLHQVEAFMTEVSRCNTIASITVPHKSLREANLNGYTIPKDCMMIISLHSILKDKDYWGDPENFRPERFLDSNGCFVKNQEVPIFGAGKRICPGESLARNTLFLFFTSLIQNYKFSIPKGQPKPSTVCMTGFTQAPQPFEVLVTRRT